MQTLIKTPIADHNAKIDALEAMIDSHTLGGVLDIIAEVCSAKADHILTNWQDDATADQWDRYSAALLGLQDQIARGKI
jgi:phage gp36-like protein